MLASCISQLLSYLVEEFNALCRLQHHIYFSGYYFDSKLYHSYLNIYIESEALAKVSRLSSCGQARRSQSVRLVENVIMIKDNIV